MPDANTASNGVPVYVLAVLRTGEADFAGTLRNLVQVAAEVNRVATGQTVDAAPDGVANVARVYREWMAQNPPPLAQEEDWRRLPPASQRLMRIKSARAIATLETRLPASLQPLAESTRTTILLDDWAGYARSTVGIVTRAGQSDLLFLMPRLTVDVASGTTVGAASQAQTAMQSAGPAAAMNASGPSPADLARALAQFASAAVFVLEMPYGALASGAIQFFMMLFGGGSNSNQFIMDAIAQALASIREFEALDDLKKAIGSTQDALTWMQSTSVTIKDLGSQSDVIDLINSQIMSDIETVVGPNSLLGRDLGTMFNLGVGSDAADWDVRSSSLDALSIGLGTYFTFLRFKIQCQATLEAAPGYAGGRLVYAAFDYFRQAVQHWAELVPARVKQLQDERVALIGQLQSTHGTPPLKLFAPPPARATVSNAFDVAATVLLAPPPVEGYTYTFVDAEPGSPPQQYFVPDDGCCQSIPDEVVKWRQSYVDNVTASVQTRYKGTTDMLTGFTTAVSSWDENLAPRMPVDTPDLGALASWTGVVPNGPNWVAGAKVRYAVSFANASGASAMGPWCDWAGVANRSLPQLSLPIDPLGLATARHVHRQFTAPSATQPGAIQTVGIVQDNETRKWVDVRE